MASFLGTTFTPFIYEFYNKMNHIFNESKFPYNFQIPLTKALLNHFPVPEVTRANVYPIKCNILSSLNTYSFQHKYLCFRRLFKRTIDLAFREKIIIVFLAVFERVLNFYLHVHTIEKRQLVLTSAHMP